ncbi:MAG TPA: four helix bundle protein [Phycisphaerales bacterium]|nr:four helix bundle protein [Phycisphaerales bacterium]
MSRDHRKLKAFVLADDLAIRVYEATRGFPREEQFGITSQMRRAAYSAPSNIVEGCGRHSTRDFLRFLDSALGSLRELGYFISLAHRLGYLDAEQARALSEAQDEAARVLAGVISSLRRDDADV